MQDQRGLIQSLREGVDVVRMIFFLKAKETFVEKYKDRPEDFPRLLSAAMLNRLFGTPNPESPYKEFAEEYEDLIDKELSAVPKNFPELLIPLTDALRIHFLCNHCEGMPDLSAEILARARDYGILQEDRDVPLPKGFMNLVYRIGKAYGLLAPTQTDIETQEG
ncbi:MAG: hypothetical protein GXO58_04180 [Thermodesulfobacteria bacterium]|nr:hypothetical protein [Thermodesulfobacteriota bacterium]